MRVLIIDDHPLVRSSLKQLLQHNFPQSVVEEASNAASTVAQAGSGNWDLILLDIDLPDRSGLDLLRDLRSLAPKTPVLVLSGGDERQVGQRALKSGAAGFIAKACAQEKIQEAIQRVLSGKKAISPDLAAVLLDTVVTDERPLHDSLSEREFEVLRLLGTGCTVSSIAERLAVSSKTVSTHRTRILEKLALKTTGDLVRYAVMNNLA